MAKDKFTRIIRPNSKKSSRENTPTAISKSQTEATEKTLKGKSEEVFTQKEEKESPWSGWAWSDERGFYYRARKDAKAGEGIWQYEYTAESHPTITPIAAQKDETPHYIETSIEYPTQERKVLYEAYTYELSSSGESVYKVPVREELSTGVVSNGEENVQKQGKEGAEAVKAVPEKDKRGKESKVRVERVGEWVRCVNDAFQDGEGEEDSGDAKVEKDSKVKQKDKHSKKREEKHKDHKERRR